MFLVSDAHHSFHFITKGVPSLKRINYLIPLIRSTRLVLCRKRADFILFFFLLFIYLMLRESCSLKGVPALPHLWLC